MQFIHLMTRTVPLILNDSELTLLQSEHQTEVSTTNRAINYATSLIITSWAALDRGDVTGSKPDPD